MMPPRATSVPRTRMTYSCESSATSSRMRTGGMTMPSSEAIWRRIVPTRCSSVPPAPLVDHRHEAEADRQLERVERERVERGVARGGQLAGRAGAGAAAAAAAVTRLAALFGSLRSVQPTAKNTPPMTRNGIFGSPGTSAKAMITTPATSGALRCSSSWSATSVPRSCSDAERVTRMPVATEISSAGICAQRPSPTVSSEKCAAASPNGMPCCMTPMTMPPTRLMPVIRMPAIASPLTNFEAPSIAP